MPRTQDLVIFVTTTDNRQQTDNRQKRLPLVHARGVIISYKPLSDMNFARLGTHNTMAVTCPLQSPLEFISPCSRVVQNIAP